MSKDTDLAREGSIDAPTRNPIDWKNPSFYDEDALFAELERVFDVCHGCRRCFSLCNAFPDLFDRIDESASGELDGVDKPDYWKVVDQCYLCDMCFMTKCPYVPPHPFNIDFPHLMLRAKAVRFQRSGAPWRDRVLSSTDALGRAGTLPVVAPLVNAANASKPVRRVLEKVIGIHADAGLPRFERKTFPRRMGGRAAPALSVEPAGGTRGRALVFATCYGRYNLPRMVEDLVAVFEHNGVPVRHAPSTRCCGMPKLELGDLEAIERAKDANIPILAEWVDRGYDIIAPVPSCALMFKQELPLLFAGDAGVEKVRQAFYDPFEYLALRHGAGKLRTDFKQSLGKVACHVPCHLRVQNIGLKTRDILALVPGTEVEAIERCSGHDGTYAVKREFHEISMKIGRPVMRKVEQSACSHFCSDCPMAAAQIHNGLGNAVPPEHPLGLLRLAYGIE